MKRRVSRIVQVGDVYIGGDHPITVQSMLSVPSTDISGNVEQALSLQKAGCEIIRVAIPDMDAVKLIPELKAKLSIPIVADIHFDYRLALAAVKSGVDKVRINPGNIGSIEKVRLVANACKKNSIPIRIGVNSGSLERDILKKYGKPTARALCESAMRHARLLEQCDFHDIVISMKSSDVQTMIDAYELIAKQCDYPLHLGVTEAGSERTGIVKSACGIGSLLTHGIGDTVRVSLTAAPEREVEVGFDILRSLKLRNKGVQIISCPTCGRTRINIIDLVHKAEQRFKHVDKDIVVAIMGCVVNGPGEAREADIGIAGGNGEGLLFKKGKILRKVPEEMLLDELEREISSI